MTVSSLRARSRADRRAQLVERARTAGVRVNLKPVDYVELYGPPHTRCTGCDHKPAEHDAGGRLDRLVLRYIASCSSWAPATWGQSTWPAVPTIARETGYCDRSVQYSLRRLVASGYLALDACAGPRRTNLCRILRPVEPIGAVDTEPETVDDAGDNPASGDAADPGRLHHHGATVAPNLLQLPTYMTPPPPDRGWEKVDGADAPAHAAPRAPRSGSPPSEAAPPRPAEPGSQPHRGMRGDLLRAEAAGWSVEDAGAALSEPLTPERAPGRLSRLAALGRRCPRCGARPDDACRNLSGRLRKSMHAERRQPDVYGPAARAGCWRDPPDPTAPRI